MAIFEEAIANIAELLAPMWVELSFMLFFALGFALFPRTQSGMKAKKAADEKSKLLFKEIDVDYAAGHSAAALKTWELAKVLAPAPLETLKGVVLVLLELRPTKVIEEVLEHFGANVQVLGNCKCANAVLDVVARAGRADLLDQLAREFRQQLKIRPTFQTYEILLGGHASAGDDRRVLELCAEIQSSNQKLTARAYSLTIKGFLKNGMVDAALRQTQEMHRQGFFVPPFAVAQLCRTACQNDRGAEMFEAASDTLKIPPEAIVVLIESCQKRNDLDLALRVEKHARSTQTALPVSAYDGLLKICVGHANVHALDIFQDMQKEGQRISEGLCVGLLARCADSKFLRFAEEIATFVRGRDGMSIAVYSSLMKVYAYCGLYDKACDLYAFIKAEGLEPDSMMYGCLMKFSVECGRTELSQELFDKAPQLDIQNYMSLIRAAGRDKDVKRAFAVLEKLKSSNVSIDIAAYNCVLDACVSAGDMKRARALIAEMPSITKLDIITFNTLLKGYCSKGDVVGAKDLFLEMERAGLAPNDVSYNCMINAAVSSGDVKEAWNMIDMMERNGVAIDHFTISIMMKAVKFAKNPKDVSRALALLDRTGVDVCSDEVLLNTALETCTRHRQANRLADILANFTTSKLRPSVHTYGSLIKACSMLKRLEQCRALWRTMVEECAMQPNDIVLGCMLDALVCNGKAEEAVQMLSQWKTTIAPNTVMYSTIIKGFANNRQAKRALDMWREMLDLGLVFNTVVFNTLIDSQARIGAMHEVQKLVESMEPCGCTPDAITYSTIVKGYCTKGDLDKAFEVFRNMQSNNMAVDCIIYNTVMDGCTRHNRMDLVDLVLADMDKYHIKPSNFTLGILMKMYGRRHMLDRAFEVIEELPRKNGFKANSQAKTCLMGACLSNHDAERALKVFEDMRKSGEDADARAYGSLVQGLVRLGHCEKAVTVIEDAYGLSGPRGLPEGQFLEAECLEQLIRALAARKLMPTVGVPLLERLRAARVPISGKLFTSSLKNS